jgi:hypothetical protein
MKKIRIIYIDPFDDFGHLALNRHFVEMLAKEGYDVTVVMSAACLVALKLEVSINQVAIPSALYNGKVNRLTERIRHIAILRHIRRSLPIESFDFAFYSNFDEIVLELVQLKLPSILLAHANIANLKNPIKLFFMRRVIRGNTVLVFHQYIRKKCLDYGIFNVEVVSQGISAPFKSRTDERKALLKVFDQRLTSPNYNHVLFAPSGTKYSDRMLADAIGDTQFRSFLRDRKILLVVKCDIITPLEENIIIVKTRIAQPLYEALFLESRAVILNYPHSFSYRVSSILFECFSNEKVCLLSDIEAFRVFAPHFRYDPFFSNQSGLMSAIDRVIRIIPPAATAPFSNREDLCVDFGFIRKLIT